MAIKAFGMSQSGPVRQINEDSCLADEELGLCVVADGMGGHAAGEVASWLAVDSIANFIRRSADSQDLSWPCGIDSSLSFAGNRLRTAIYLANKRVFRQAESRDDYMGMGTTVVCALTTGARVSIGHVGDSRLYLFSGGVLSAQTRDDTWAQTILAGTTGEADPGAVKAHPMHHVLTNVLGVRDQIDIHISERDLAPDDTLLLCSDGVHNVVDPETLTALMAREGDPRTLAESVVQAALDLKSTDNVTALIVRYLGDGAPHV